MNILVIGGGGREHSICWSVKKSKICKSIYCIPGNAGISEIAECSELDLNKKDKLVEFCKIKKIDLVIIGPEKYLENGLSDYLTNKNINVFGPSKKAAMLETSKSFAKSFLLNSKSILPNIRNFLVIMMLLNSFQMLNIQ